MKFHQCYVQNTFRKRWLILTGSKDIKKTKNLQLCSMVMQYIKINVCVLPESSNHFDFESFGILASVKRLSKPFCEIKLPFDYNLRSLCIVVYGSPRPKSMSQGITL